MGKLAISMGLMAPTTILPDAIQKLAMSGLTDGAAVMGDHASISVGFPTGVTAWTSQGWGYSYGDTALGVAETPDDFSAGPATALLWEGVGDDGDTYRAAAPIRFVAGSAAGALADRPHVEGVAITPYSVAGDFSGDGLDFDFAQAGLPAGLGMTVDGDVSGTPEAAVNAAVVVITATDQYGRTLTSGYNVDVLAYPALSGQSLANITTTTATYSSQMNRAGDVYRLVSANPVETRATIEAQGAVAVAANTDTVLNITGLAADTQFYVHEVGTGGLGNDTPISVTAGQTLASAPAPVISIDAFNDATDTFNLRSTQFNAGAWIFARTAQTETLTPDGAGGFQGGTVLQTGSLPVGAENSQVVFPTNGTDGQPFRIHIYQRVAGVDANIVAQDYVEGIPSAALFSDTFSSFADGDNLAANANYSTYQGNQTVEARGGVAQLVGGGFAITQVDAVAERADFEISVIVTDIGDPSGTSNKIALFGRGSDAANVSRYSAEFFDGSVIIAKRVGSSNTTLLTVNSQPLLNGDEVKFRGVGTTLRALINDVQIGTDVTDADLTSGRVGFVLVANGDPTERLKFDNLTVEAAS